MNTHLLLGAHMSTAGGIPKSVERALATGCTTMQIFTKSNKSWFAPPIDNETCVLFKQAVKAANLQHIMAHSAYLINIGSNNAMVVEKSIESLRQELVRCHQLDIPYLILHPGAHTGAGAEQGLAQIAHNLDVVFESCEGNTKILLETAAGQGTTLGSTFNEIQVILATSAYPERLGICLDTCHIFAAGYDLLNIPGWFSVIDEFDRVIGLEKLHAIHLNDSATPIGSKKDRHAKIGKGLIPLEIFKTILMDKRLSHIPKVLETPAIDALSEYKEEIAMLKELIGVK